MLSKELTPIMPLIHTYDIAITNNRQNVNNLIDIVNFIKQALASNRSRPL